MARRGLSTGMRQKGEIFAESLELMRASSYNGAGQGDTCTCCLVSQNGIAAQRGARLLRGHAQHPQKG